MIGKLLVIGFMPGMIFGMVYLLLIMWYVTGYTPIDVIEVITDTVTQPLIKALEQL